MATKKAFVPIVELLEANKNKQVSAVLEKVYELTAAKAGGGGRSSSSVLRNDAGDVTHIFCYYHKKWEDVSVAEYGKKASSPTGFSNMCKEGTAAWTKQQRDAKKAREDLLTAVSEGSVNPSDISGQMEKIEKDRSKIIAREDKHGTTDAPGGEKAA
jgi:hypothetical protein